MRPDPGQRQPQKLASWFDKYFVDPPKDTPRFQLDEDVALPFRKPKMTMIAP